MKLGRCLWLIVLFSCGSALADRPLVRQAGEWQTMMTSSLPDTAPQQTQACYRAESAEDIIRHMAGCGRVDPVTRGGHTSFDAVCSRGDTIVTLHGDIEAIGRDSFHSQVHASYAPPIGAISEMTVTGDSHRLGPCPKGEAPVN